MKVPKHKFALISEKGNTIPYFVTAYPKRKR
jgi:hypothetical protein